MSFRQTAYERWLKGWLISGQPKSWNLPDSGTRVGPSRGGRYRLTLEQDRALFSPIPHPRFLRRLHSIFLDDRRFTVPPEDVHEHVAPFTLCGSTLKTSLGLAPRIERMLVESGAEVAPVERGGLAARCAVPDSAAVALAADSESDMFFVDAILRGSPRGIVRHAGRERRDKLIARLISFYPQARVACIVPSRDEIEAMHRVFSRVRTKVPEKLRTVYDRPWRSCVANLSAQFECETWPPLDIVIFPRAELLLQRRGAMCSLLNRGFPYRVYGFVDPVLGLNDAEIQQIEFFSGPSLYCDDAVEHGWYREQVAWPSPDPLDGEPEAPNDDFLKSVTSLARVCAESGNETSAGDGGDQPGASGRRKVAILTPSAKLAQQLSAVAPDFALATLKERQNGAEGAPVICSQTALTTATAFDYDVVLSLGPSPEESPLCRLLAKKRLRAVRARQKTPLWFLDVVQQRASPRNPPR